jgi:methionyl-tRNA formyltransferase
MIVHLRDGDYEILELQPSGKPKMLARDFINGLKK